MVLVGVGGRGVLVGVAEGTAVGLDSAVAVAGAAAGLHPLITISRPRQTRMVIGIQVVFKSSAPYKLIRGIIIQDTHRKILASIETQILVGLAYWLV